MKNQLKENILFKKFRRLEKKTCEFLAPFSLLLLAMSIENINEFDINDLINISLTSGFTIIDFIIWLKNENKLFEIYKNKYYLNNIEYFENNNITINDIDRYTYNELKKIKRINN